MQYINFLLGRNCYRDINLYFTYATQYSNSLQQKLIFLSRNGSNNSFAILEYIQFYEKILLQEKRGNGYVIGSRDQRQRLGNRAYLMSLIWENDNTIIAKK